MISYICIMEKIPNASELIRSEFVDGEFDEIMDCLNGSLEPSIISAMHKFARLHVEAALKAAAKSVHVELFVRPNRKGSRYKKAEAGEAYDISGTRQMWKANKNSLLTAYQVDSINE